ncbi:MAG: hypothetical protein MJ172_04595 [Clostridia bacterium]|nr:hypothetical protein [Clostridia bacterium]
MKWLNGKPLCINYAKEKQEADAIKEAIRLIGNNSITPDPIAMEVINELSTHKSCYVPEVISSESYRAYLNTRDIKISQYEKDKRAYCLLFYELYQLKKGGSGNAETV